jgi:predicted DNA binding CopG/RHH family protein
MSSNKTTRKNLEARFDAGADVTDYFAVEKAFRRNHCKERVNVDMPHWMILKIDRIAGRKGLARQAQIKEWLADKLKEEEKAVA